MLLGYSTNNKRVQMSTIFYESFREIVQVLVWNIYDLILNLGSR